MIWVDKWLPQEELVKRCDSFKQKQEEMWLSLAKHLSMVWFKLNWKIEDQRRKSMSIIA